jgi:glycosyltransferase involved in cell wall biosynthesis
VRKIPRVKVLHLSYADSHEGAAIGAYRLHRAMLNEGIDSRILVQRKKLKDPTAIQIGLFRRAVIKIFRILSKVILRLQKPENFAVRSLNIFPTGIHRIINRMDVDIVQFHWINMNTISISEIGKIKKPIVWKLPDMWAFNGAEHYLSPGDPERYKTGYDRNNRPEGDRGLDIDRWTWRYKRKCWRAVTMTIVTPSKWLGDCARQSKLFQDYKVYNIPNPINLDHYKPYASKGEARQVINLPASKTLILFGAFKATSDRRKGFHHLQKCLEYFTSLENNENCELVILGSTGPENTTMYGMKVHYLGSVFGDDLLRAIYSAADVMVLPTEADNLPNTIQEAMACGTPCVGFDVGGLPDMIAHERSGYLAKPFDEKDLAHGIGWVLSQDHESLSHVVRDSAVKLHDPKKRVADYMEIYREVLGSRQ